MGLLISLELVLTLTHHEMLRKAWSSSGERRQGRLAAEPTRELVLGEQEWKAGRSRGIPRRIRPAQIPVRKAVCPGMYVACTLLWGTLRVAGGTPQGGPLRRNL